MKYQVEPLSPELAGEIEQMFRAYYHETPAHKGLPPYDFNWKLYGGLSIDGKLLVITARDGQATMRGVNMYIIMEHPHHAGLIVAECDSLATAHTHRGQGIGRKMIELGEHVLRNKGIHRVLHHYRTVYPEEPVFPKVGYELVQQTYSKDL